MLTTTEPHRVTSSNFEKKRNNNNNNNNNNNGWLSWSAKGSALQSLSAQAMVHTVSRTDNAQTYTYRCSQMLSRYVVFGVQHLSFFGSHYVVLSRSFSCVSFGWMGGVDQPKPDQNQKPQGS